MSGAEFRVASQRLPPQTKNPAGETGGVFNIRTAR